MKTETQRERKAGIKAEREANPNKVKQRKLQKDKEADGK